jgi:hypothetical protein
VRYFDSREDTAWKRADGVCGKGCRSLSSVVLCWCHVTRIGHAVGHRSVRLSPGLPLRLVDCSELRRSRLQSSIRVGCPEDSRQWI